MEYMQKTAAWINAVLSDYVLTALLIACGVFFSIRTRFVRFRCFGEGFRNALGGSRGGTRRGRSRNIFRIPRVFHLHSLGIAVY